ncbi:MAG: D-2-hydroxyacid dehydrogenase [Clostridia bacterium]|nr:D-2-hydroxyacid dehydrogenase [Clostridia bacterium]
MNLLITGAWSDAKAYFEQLSQMGHCVFFLQNEKDDPLPLAYDDVQGVVCNGLFLHHSIDAFTNLRYIQLTSAGLDRVPMDAVRARGIRVVNAGGVYSVPMAEFALAGVLSLYKQLRAFECSRTRQAWEKRRDLIELCEKTVLIVGCGSVGNECAKRFGAFGCTVKGVDLYPRADALYADIVGLDALDVALAEADITVLTLPLTEQTRHLMDRTRLATMKKGSLLVNIARGAIVDSSALLWALDEHLGGAVLDVFETEPLPESNPLWDKKNVILTPHNSFVGEKNAERLANLIIQNLRSES